MAMCNDGNIKKNEGPLVVLGLYNIIYKFRMKEC